MQLTDPLRRRFLLLSGGLALGMTGGLTLSCTESHGGRQPPYREAGGVHESTTYADYDGWMVTPGEKENLEAAQNASG